jgi:hypothetical protein
LKNAIEPSPTARQRFEAKGQHAYAQRSARTTLIATQHRDVVKLPWNDRRFSVITCGRKMTPSERTEIRAWMEIPENIGALYRALLMRPAVPLDVFDPYGDPPPFAGRLEMIEMAASRIEDAYEAMLDALDGYPLFTMTQAKRLIGYFGDYASGDWSDRALHTVSKNAYRLRDEHEPGGRIRHLKRREAVYACSEIERRRWRRVDKAMIVAQLDRTEEQVKRTISGGGGQSARSGELIDIAAQLKEASQQSSADKKLSSVDASMNTSAGTNAGMSADTKQPSADKN